MNQITAKPTPKGSHLAPSRLKLATALSIFASITPTTSAFCRPYSVGPAKINNQFRPLTHLPDLHPHNQRSRLDSIQLNLFGFLFGNHDEDDNKPSNDSFALNQNEFEHELDTLFAPYTLNPSQQLGCNEHYLSAIHQFNMDFALLTKPQLYTLAHEPSALNEDERNAIQHAVDLAQCQSGSLDKPLGLLLLTPNSDINTVGRALKNELSEPLVLSILSRIPIDRSGRPKQLCIDISSILREYFRNQLISDTIKNNPMVEWAADFHQAVRVYYKNQISPTQNPTQGSHLLNEPSDSDDKEAVFSGFPVDIGDVDPKEEEQLKLSDLEIENFSWHQILLRLVYETVLKKSRSELPESMVTMMFAEPEVEFTLAKVARQLIEQAEKVSYSTDGFERRIIRSEKYGIDATQRLRQNGAWQTFNDPSRPIHLDLKTDLIKINKGVRLREVKAFLKELFPCGFSALHKIALPKTVPFNFRGRTTMPVELPASLYLRGEVSRYLAVLIKDPTLYLKTASFANFHAAIKARPFPKELSHRHQAILQSLESHNRLLMKESIMQNIQRGAFSPALLQSKGFSNLLDDWITLYQMPLLNEYNFDSAEILRLIDKHFPVKGL